MDDFKEGDVFMLVDRGNGELINEAAVFTDGTKRYRVLKSSRYL